MLKRADGETEIDGAQGRAQGKGLVAALPGVARSRRGRRVWSVRKSGSRARRCPRPKRGEYYWVDLEGLEVVTTEGVALGEVSHLFATGANDVMVVKDGERERLIPFVLEQFVHEVDLDAGRITVDWDPDFNVLLKCGQDALLILRSGTSA